MDETSVIQTHVDVLRPANDSSANTQIAASSAEEAPRPVASAPQQHKRDSSYIRAAMQSHAGVRRTAADSDAAQLVGLLDQHVQALMQDAVEHLLSVKANMLASLDTAVAAERDAGASKLGAKQAEVDILKGELHNTQQHLSRIDGHLQRLCGAYAIKHEQVLDTRAFISAWFKWRAHIARKRRIARQALRAEHYFVRHWLLGRAWDRWAGRARSHYRQLVAERAEQQRQQEAAALSATHAQEVGSLREEIEALQHQLQQEAAARNKMEEEMKRAFMRGVTAINLEAVQIMRRGAPPAGANPFPITLPLSASTAAAGLTAVQQQHQQQLGLQVQQQEQQQMQQGVDEREEQEQAPQLALQGMEAAVPQASSSSSSPGAPSCVDAPGTAVVVPPRCANNNSVAVGQTVSGLATWSTVQSTQAAAVDGCTSAVSAAVGAQQHDLAAAPRNWAGNSNSITSMVVPQAPGAALPRVSVERGPAAGGRAGGALDSNLRAPGKVQFTATQQARVPGASAAHPMGYHAASARRR